MMKKRVLCFVIVLVMMFSLQALPAEAAGVSATFYVEKNPEAGLSGKVNVTVLSSTYTLCLPREAKVDQLMMSWTVASGVTVKVDNQVVTSGETPVPAVGSGSKYTVPSGYSSSTYTITTMQSSTSVGSLFVDVDETIDVDGTPGTISAMRNDPDHERSCYGKLTLDGATYDMSIKGRGNWTWCNPDSGSDFRKKQPYNLTIYKDEDAAKEIIRFDKKKSVEFIDGVKSKKWTLIANYADGSLMRNKIGYDLACKLGIGLESRYIDVWMNGDFIGNYLITAKNDYDVADNGYALELDNNEDTDQFSLDGLPSSGSAKNAITVKGIGDEAEAGGVTTETIQTWMQTVWNAVAETGSEEYTKYIDVDSWAKLYLIQEYCKNYDVLCGSILMHRDGQTENDKLIAGPIWDLDNAWGRIWNNSYISDSVQKSADGWYIESINGCVSFLQYLGKHESFMKRVYAIFNEYYDAFAGALTEIGELKTEIAASAAMNYKAFSVTQSQYNATLISSNTTRGSGTYAYSLVKTSSWENYVTNLQNYVTQRLAYMTDQLKVTAPEVPVISGETTVNVNSAVSFTASGTADAYQWQSSENGKDWTAISGATGKSYSTTALTEMNGMQLRCVAENTGSVINTTNVAKAAPGMTSTSEPVTLTVVDLSAIPFYVKKNEDAGLDGKVSVQFSGSGQNYSGTLYLPGSAQAASLKLYWDAADCVTVKNGDQIAVSGEAPIAANGESITYTVSCGEEAVSYTIRTMQGSASAGAVFLKIDESYDDGSHTIQQMKTDETHEAACFGTLSVDGKTYDMSIKGHGNDTWFSEGVPLDKQPYNITFYKDETTDRARFDEKKNVALISEVESKKWILLANYADGTMMRNKIGYDLACRLGIGQESRYVDVWMNGEYIGNYLATPKVDANVAKDGYMLELDNMQETEDPQFRLEELDASGSLYNGITVKALGKNLEDDTEAVSKISTWMQAAWAAIQNAGSDEYLNYIDIDSWAKLYLIQEYCKNYDVVCGSIYMHRDGQTDADKLIAGPVWDLDNAWGRVYANGDSGIDSDIQLSADGWYIDSIEGPTAILQYLGKHQDFMEYVYDVFNRYTDDFAAVLTEIDQLRSDLKASADMNYDVWDVQQTQFNTTAILSETTRGSGEYAFPQVVTDSWEDYVSNLKSYVEARFRFLSDSLILSAPEEYGIIGNTTVEADSALRLTGDCTASAYQWQSSDDGENWTDISGATGKTYTDTALSEMDCLNIRCKATVSREISTRNVAKVELSKTAVSAPVTLSVLEFAAECQEENGVLQFSVSCKDVRRVTTGKFHVIVALYEPSGRLAGIQIAEAAAEQSLEAGLQLAVSKPDAAVQYSWKAMAVDESFAPLMSFCD